jgi:hypothetical protein
MIGVLGFDPRRQSPLEADPASAATAVRKPLTVERFQTYLKQREFAFVRLSKARVLGDLLVE